MLTHGLEPWHTFELRARVNSGIRGFPLYSTEITGVRVIWGGEVAEDEHNSLRGYILELWDRNAQCVVTVCSWCDQDAADLPLDAVNPPLFST